MALPTHLQQLLDYDEWADRELARALTGLATPPPRAVQLLNHVIGASFLWLARLEGRPSPCAVWPEWTLARCASEIAELRAKWGAWTKGGGAARLDATIAYVNSKGEPHSSRVADVLTHVALHGVHHRAQVLAELRAAGHAPPYLDFIHATRTGQLAT
jgi:uncharacterized damage-inducible protein DinB